MMKKILVLFISLIFPCLLIAQEIPARWDELVASDFQKAIEKSSKTCILPIGILEKHGPHSPLGTDLIHVREWAAHAVKEEYAVVFPDYFYGQINEARQQPGTFALPSKVILDLLEATCDEIGRNGFDKIIILNGHGGNPEFLEFFMQSLLNKRHNYAVYLYRPEQDPAYMAKYLKMHKSNQENDQHAGERETSTLLYYRPDLMRMDRAAEQSGANQKRSSTPDLYTPIWWYSSYPNHYAGEGDKATKEFGKFIADHEIASFVKALRTVKADTKTLELQNEFYDRVNNLNK
ncbi:MAG: creatininase family protein [Bacteroidetes bacterium]|nr:creatininase family protein [Bacteroidota bacterium]MBU1373735.1 creatininase family protein [Bacteroidota bacterium]MBU1486109.1 creatininase family protein [Bacteroidota bacterium]MBU1760611.1 creatininase family protein [Bacteroidota bacterium]MBU2046694.1 creatininase family protein [Bacteroidota bacterium]